MKHKKDDAPERIRRYMNMYPVRNPNLKVERKDDGHVVIIYKKNLKRFENWLQRRIGGPENIRRPLDQMGTSIWDLCDGDKKIIDICNKMEEEFKEEISPAIQRVTRFLVMLQQRNLVIISDEPLPDRFKDDFKKKEDGNTIKEEQTIITTKEASTDEKTPETTEKA